MPRCTRRISIRTHLSFECLRYTGMTRWQILMSGRTDVYTDGERPRGYGPSGPSDRELLDELMVQSRARPPLFASPRKGGALEQPLQKQWRDLSRATPTATATPSASSNSSAGSDMCGEVEECADATIGGGDPDAMLGLTDHEAAVLLEA